MCYMTVPERVGVRELRQNLSVYLRRVKKGETIEVTERGATVARLSPTGVSSKLERLIAEGRIVPADRDLRELPRPKPLPAGSKPLSTILEELRDVERY